MVPRILSLPCLQFHFDFFRITCVGLRDAKYSSSPLFWLHFKSKLFSIGSFLKAICGGGLNAFDKRCSSEWCFLFHTSASSSVILDFELRIDCFISNICSCHFFSIFSASLFWKCISKLASFHKKLIFQRYINIDAIYFIGKENVGYF